MAKKLRIIPLGGLGEIGKNMTVYEYGRNMMVVDCGVMFPENDMYGIDLVLPDFDYVVQNQDRLRGIVLTHGHMDHIAALPYLLREVEAPIYGTSLTLGLVERQLAEKNVLHRADLQPLDKREMVHLGPFRYTLAALATLAAVVAGCSESPTAPSGSAPYSQTDLVMGTGAEAVAGTVVSVAYEGWFYDQSKGDGKGVQFDSSVRWGPMTRSVWL